ncbi:MAG: DUF2889 domain-containing protein [Deltaproteobacteria bacterium]|nr:DUF2889 domain-containing protein [Deltaproteobacteria bacterium]
MLSLRIAWGAADSVVAEGRILDLRKRGVVPMLGKLQGPGVVHDMAVRMVVDPRALLIREIQPVMSAFPFTAAAATRGEGCPDRLPDVQRLVGASLRDGFGPRLGADIGGPRGCFHIFTMLRMIGPTIELVCERQQRLHPTAPAAGGPLFSRSLIIDGLKGEGLSLVLRGALFDLHYRPGADALPIDEELEEGRVAERANGGTARRQAAAQRVHGSGAGRVRTDRRPRTVAASAVHDGAGDDSVLPESGRGDRAAPAPRRGTARGRRFVPHVACRRTVGECGGVGDVSDNKNLRFEDWKI